MKPNCGSSKQANNSAYRCAHYFACYIDHAEFLAFGERRRVCAPYGEQAGGHIGLSVGPLSFRGLAVNVRHRLGPIHVLRMSRGGRDVAFAIL